MITGEYKQQPSITALFSSCLLILTFLPIISLHGTLPPEMFKPTNELRPFKLFMTERLSEIDVSWNYLSGVVPSELFDLESLTQLNLEGNYQEGNCSRYDGTSIDMSSDGLEGNILGPGIGKLNKLELLKLSQNNFRGPISSRISNLNRLSEYYGFVADITNISIFG